MYDKAVQFGEYLAIDPGLTSGWAMFDNKGELVEMGQFKYDDGVPTLNRLLGAKLKVVIIEDYRNHGHMQQKKWSRNETSKLIGKIETLCELHEIKVALQPNTCKPVGYKWAGIKPPSNHSISHQTDAYAHGVYWLQQNDVRPIGLALRHKLAKEKENK